MSETVNPDLLTVGLAQIAPVWLDRAGTLEKIIAYVDQAAVRGCQLVAFGETLLPGYPYWVERTDGARFNSPIQKDIHAHYLDQAVDIEAGHLAPLQERARRHGITVMVGCAERAADRGGHSVYCSLVRIGPDGVLQNVHRKLTPTYEERLTWAPGDGHGLRTQPIGRFTMGGLNCWENWMPLSRAALYAQGEDLHVAVWPGGLHNTHDTTRFIAKEMRGYVLAVSGLMQPGDVPAGTPHRDLIVSDQSPLWSNGGSAIAAPDGSWLVEPLVGEEGLLVATLDHREVRRERQNFDPAGHYSRPDVTRLVVDRRRQALASFED
jgi:nitrilase